MCPALTARIGRTAAFNLPMASGAAAAASRGIDVRSVPFCASRTLTICFVFPVCPRPVTKRGESAEGAETRELSQAQGCPGTCCDILCHLIL